MNDLYSFEARYRARNLRWVFFSRLKTGGIEFFEGYNVEEELKRIEKLRPIF
jgi:hypothetical protein